MSRKTATAKTVVVLTSRTLAEEAEAVLDAIDTDIVDASTIASVKRILSFKAHNPSSAVTSTTAYPPTKRASSLASTKANPKTPSAKTGDKSRTVVTSDTAQDSLPSEKVVAYAKSIMMRCLSSLTTISESKPKKAETKSSEERTSPRKESISQSRKNIISCCKLALDSLRQWQDHKDIGATWVNKAYLAFTSKLMALELSEHALKELGILKGDIEKQLSGGSPGTKSKPAARQTNRRLQNSTKQNLPLQDAPINPLPLLSIQLQAVEDDEQNQVICAYFNHVLRAIACRPKYEVDATFIDTLEFNNGPIAWIQKLPQEQSSHQLDNLNKSLLKIALSCKNPETQLALRTLRHRFALKQPSTSLDSIAKSTFQALRSYYAATKNDKVAFEVCKQTLSPVLDRIVESKETNKIVNFMGVLARKVGLFQEAMKWNDLGLRKFAHEDRCAKAIYLLRNAGILFSLPAAEFGIVPLARKRSDLDALEQELVALRLEYTRDMLNYIGEFEPSDLEQVRDEVDYLRRSILAMKPEVFESRSALSEARNSLPPLVLETISVMAQHSSLASKLVMPTRALIFDIVSNIKLIFSPYFPPENYRATLDLCTKAALAVQDFQSLQVAGNQFFNCGNALYKVGKKDEAKQLLEESLRFDTLYGHGAEVVSDEERKRIALGRCRKLELLAELSVKGQESHAFNLLLGALNVHLSVLELTADMACLSVPQIMRKEEYLTRLIGILTRFAKQAESEWSPGDDGVPIPNPEFSIILEDHVPLEIKAMVYEIQIHILLGMTHPSRYAAAAKLCRHALRMYDDLDCTLRCVRIIERLLYISVVEGDLNQSLHLADTAIEKLTGKNVLDTDEGLIQSKKLLLARCLTWLGLLQASTNCDTVFIPEALVIWTRWSDKFVNEQKQEDTDEAVEVVKILDLLSEFLEFKCLSLLRVHCLHLLLKLQHHLKQDLNVIIHTYASLGVQYLRLGYTGKAGTIFAQGLKHMKDASPSKSIQLTWHLAYAEYFARIGNLTKAKSHMSDAEFLYSESFGSPKKRIDAAERAERILAVGRAGYVLSVIAFEESELEKAVSYVDYAVRVLKTGITSVKRSSQKKTKSASQDYDPFSSAPKQFEPEKVEKDDSVQMDPKMWAFQTAFFSALIQYGVLLTFRGSARDGEFWFRQAYDAAKSTNVSNTILVSSLHLGDLYTRMFNLAGADQFLVAGSALAENVSQTREHIMLDLALFGLEGRRDMWSKAFTTILGAERKLKELLEPAFVNALEKGEINDLADRLASLKMSIISPPRGSTSGGSTWRSSLKGGAKSLTASKKQPAKSSSNGGRVEYESATFERMQLTISEKHGYSLARQRRFAEGHLALEDISHKDLSIEAISARITRAEIQLMEVLQLLNSDPLLCVLSESAISIPNVHGKGLQKTEIEPPKRGRRTRNHSARMSDSLNRFAILLHQARDSIESLFEMACKLCPSTLARVVGLLMSEAQLLSSIICDTNIDQNNLALKTVLLLDRSRSVMYKREQAALEHEAKQQLLSLKQIEWPDRPSVSDDQTTDLTEMISGLNLTTRNSNIHVTPETLLNNIPAGCTVVSIHLSDSKEHFILSKIHAQGCIVVRLPLLKHLPDTDEAPFTFGSAYEELTTIMRLTNETAQAAKGVVDREAKETWWKSRKTLDERLGVFLQNMERCWIGGFTGMFRGFSPNDAVFAKFRATFRQILTKHLPSRKETDVPLELDPRLEDLFLSLTAESADEEHDVADQVEDLIFFALDNFKFHGEQIAIDEVDLDAMTIDIQEAIRCYHETCTPRKEEHVVLILDKSLHMFPWESLPCLRGRSVSRVPCLSALLERVVPSPEGTSWPSVAPTKGFYILNPEGDLKHTQSTFDNVLSKMQGWDGITGRAPMDQEILSALKTNDIFLYFGHGSGEQYVKSTQIKRLESASLTMLFGCSSGRLREAGDFEPFGTPFTYLLGGSPALLANLWDVTDRDIDKLTVGVFERWGLWNDRPISSGSDTNSLDSNSSTSLVPPISGLSVKERKKLLGAAAGVENIEDPWRVHGGEGKGEGMSLTKALALAREDCTLKYLNGAAPVVYGVPVFLKS